MYLKFILIRSCFVLNYVVLVFIILFNNYRVISIDCSVGEYVVFGNGICLRCFKGKYCFIKIVAFLDCFLSICF